MREILRRFVPVTLLFLGLWLICWMPGDVWSVKPIDWSEEQGRRSRQADDAVRLIENESGLTGLKSEDLFGADKSLADFIQDRTRDRLIPVAGQDWEGFFNSCAATVLGQPPDEGWRRRAEDGERPRFLYFRSSEGPIPSVRTRFDEPGTYRYVLVKGSHRDEYLGMSWAGGDDVYRRAPSSVAFPYRFSGVLLLISALVIYAAIPRVGVSTRSLHYSTARAGWLPDLMAAVAGGMFFVIPLLVTRSMGEDPFSEGWVILTGVCWFMTTLFASMWVVSTMYATSRLEWDEAALTLRTLRTTRRYAYQDVLGVEPYSWKAPGWLRVLAWGVALLNWRAAGSAVILGMDYEGFSLRTRDGRLYRYFKTGLLGAQAFLRQLEVRGVPVDPAVQTLFESSRVHQARAESGRAGKIAGIVVFSLILIGLLVAASLTWPGPGPRFVAGPLSAEAFSLPVERGREVTFEMIERENQIIEEMNKLKKRMDEVSAQLKTAPATERQGLLAEAERLTDRFSELSREFNLVRGEVAEKPE